MSPEQLAAWAAGGESETIEFKRTTGQRREATRTVCAMLNHRGGHVLFGVEADGRVVGQQVSDHTVEEVAQELREIDPPAFPSIERVSLDGGREVLVVSVPTGQSRPLAGPSWILIPLRSSVLWRKLFAAVGPRTLALAIRRSCFVVSD